MIHRSIPAGETRELDQGPYYGVRVLRAPDDATISLDGLTVTPYGLTTYVAPVGPTGAHAPWTKVRAVAGATGALEIEILTSPGEVAQLPPPPGGVVRIVDNDGQPIIGGTGSPVPVILTDAAGTQAYIEPANQSIATNIVRYRNNLLLDVILNAMVASGSQRGMAVAPFGRDSAGIGHPHLCGTDGAQVTSAQRDWTTLGTLASLATGIVQGTYTLDGYDQCAVMFVNYSGAAISPKLYAVTPDGPFTGGVQFWGTSVGAFGAIHVALQAGNGYSGSLVEGIPYVPHKVMISIPMTAANDDMKAQILAR